MPSSAQARLIPRFDGQNYRIFFKNKIRAIFQKLTSSDNFIVDDAAKDVDQDGLDARVGGDDAEGLVDALLLDSATQIEEVGRLATLQLDNVHGGHGQTGAVDEATNLTVKS